MAGLAFSTDFWNSSDRMGMLGPCRQVNCYSVLVRSEPNHTLVSKNSQSTSLKQKLLLTI